MVESEAEAVLKSDRLSQPHRRGGGQRDTVDASTPQLRIETDTPMISWLARGVGLS